MHERVSPRIAAEAVSNESSQYAEDDASRKGTPKRRGAKVKHGTFRNCQQPPTNLKNKRSYRLPNREQEMLIAGCWV